MAFQLPPNISFKKEKRSFGWVYLFRHSKLGQIGRIVPRGRADGRTQITCEVTGDPNDPMTEKRAGIFKPLGKKIADEMERITNGGKPSTGKTVKPPSNLPLEPRKGVAQKLMQCEVCDAGIGLLVLAPDAPDEGGLEDYARLMYPEISKHKLPTWIIGGLAPSQGVDDSNEPRCIIRKVYPKREAISYASPDEFNLITEKLRDRHCV